MTRQISVLILLSLFSCTNTEPVVEYWSNGNRKMEGSILDGERNGKWVFFRDWNEDTSKVEYYRNGDLFMIDSYAYATGFSDEKKEAETTSLSERNQIINGKKNGEFISYRPNRTIDSKGFYQDDLLVDTIKHFSEDGYFIAITVYERDTSIYFEQYWPNGVQRMVGKEGLNGIVQVYDSLGQPEFDVLMDINNGTTDTLQVYNR